MKNDSSWKEQLKEREKKKEKERGTFVGAGGWKCIQAQRTKSGSKSAVKEDLNRNTESERGEGEKEMKKKNEEKSTSEKTSELAGAHTPGSDFGSEEIELAIT